MKQSDEESFRAFVTGSTRRLQHAAELVTGNAQDAEDVVQAVLVRMYQRWHRIEQQDPQGYARQALANEVTDRWRRRRGREISSAVLPDIASDAGGNHDLESRDAVLRALATLTGRERAVVVLRYYLDMSEAQTAAALGIAPGTVKSTANRAFGKLRVAPDLSRETQETPS